MPEPFQASRAKGARKPEGGVLVTRPGFWGNWIVPGDPGRIWVEVREAGGMARLTARLPFAVSQSEAVEWHADWLETGRVPLGVILAVKSPLQQLLNRKRTQSLRRMPELRGKRLGCACALPAPGQADLCHRATLAARAAAVTWDRNHNA